MPVLSRTPVRRGAAVALVAAAALALTGCVPQSGGAPGQLERSLDQGQSVAQVALLALDQHVRGRSVPGFAQTSLEDALDQLGQESDGVEMTEPQTPAEREELQSTLSALSALQSALIDTRAAIQGGTGADPGTARTELQRSAAQLQKVRDELVRRSGDRA